MTPSPTNTPESDLEVLRTTAAGLGDDILALTERVLSYPGFTTCSGSLNNRHHYGLHGLLRHTTEVAGLCMISALMWDGRINERVLWLAAIHHDIGKVHDYAWDPMAAAWVAAPHHRLIHHITQSTLLWNKAVSETGLCRDIAMDVTHCILSHHGRPELGSPIMPKTREAWILHLSDCMSARIDDCDRVEMTK